MPADITGTDIIEEDPTTGHRRWTFVPGPIFGNILLGGPDASDTLKVFNSAAVLADLPVNEYTALQVKQAVVGNGHARKEQVQEMVRRLLRLPGDPSADAADALACAICHAHGGLGLGKLQTRGFRMKRGRLV